MPGCTAKQTYLLQALYLACFELAIKSIAFDLFLLVLNAHP